MAEREPSPRAGRGRPIDPAMLKALAHPLRIELLESLLDQGPSTASGLGRTVGESSGTTSYHLLRLANFGLIEEADDIGSGRDRYWRAVGGWTLESDLMDAPATQTDAQIVVDLVAQSNIERLMTWLRHFQDWPPQWRDASMMSHSRLTLTPEQTGALGEELLELVDRYRQVQHARNTPGTAQVVAQTNLFPTGDPTPMPACPEDRAGL
ncbi:helix-turn-helix domain-containing protein [soil metagenome]